MGKLDELKAEIEALPQEDYGELLRWVAEKDWGGMLSSRPTPTRGSSTS